MPRKTLKVSKRHRRRTLRKIPKRTKKGGADTQALKIPGAGFENPGNPVNSDNKFYNIA